MSLIQNKTGRNQFHIFPTTFLKDKGLSLVDRGMLATLHSLPDGWDFTINGATKILPDGKKRIGASVRRLKKRGYIAVKQEKTETGKYGNNVLEIFDEPVDQKPFTQNRSTEKRLTDNPSTENRAQSNNNKSIINTLNNPSIYLSEELKDGQTDTDTLRKLIADNINLDWLREVALQHGEEESRMLEEVYEVICDMVCVPRKNVVIKGTTYKWELVKSRFLALRYVHIANILNRIVDANLEIKNMASYLISTLYTESLVGVLEEQSKMHDDYLKFLRGKPY